VLIIVIIMEIMKEVLQYEDKILQRMIIIKEAACGLWGSLVRCDE